MTHDEMLTLLGDTQQRLYCARAKYYDAQAQIQEARLEATQALQPLYTEEFAGAFENITLDEEEAIARAAATKVGRDFDTDPLFGLERHALEGYKVSPSDEAWLASLNPDREDS